VKKLSNTKTIQENYIILGEKINPFLENLKNKQKILELCHLGKFLIFFNELSILELSEKPDFILSDNNEKIGIEHQIIVNQKPKEKEGFYKNIFEKANDILKENTELPNFLANCYVKPYVNFKLNQKNYLIEIIVSVVKEYVLNNYLIENPLIESIFKTPHSQKSVNVNLGAWWENKITKEIIIDAVDKKEKKITEYKKKKTDKQWLLMVIGGTGESSYNMDEKIELVLETKFDKVFILEDLYNNLYQIK